MILGHPPLEALFGDTEMAELWSGEAQLGHYRAFEAALAIALGATGRVPPDQARQAAEAATHADIDMASLADATRRDGVPIPDMVRQLRAAAHPNEAAIHIGATSQDVLDTALALTLKRVSQRVYGRLRALDARLRALASEMGDTPLMGRTRMQAALPIRAVDRVDSWRAPLTAHIAALDALRPRVERLQLGGPVGTREGFGVDGGRIAAHMAAALDLATGPVWHTDRTAITEYGCRLSLITGSLGKLGQDVALMAQQGIDEIVLKVGGGSSAMPHKSNPIRAELLVTLARFNATQIGGLHQALIHEQERSGSAWMLEWIILPQMAGASARALGAAQELINSIARVGRDAKGPDPRNG